MMDPLNLLIEFDLFLLHSTRRSAPSFKQQIPHKCLLLSLVNTLIWGCDSQQRKDKEKIIGGSQKELSLCYLQNKSVVKHNKLPDSGSQLGLGYSENLLFWPIELKGKLNSIHHQKCVCILTHSVPFNSKEDVLTAERGTERMNPARHNFNSQCENVK